MPRARSLPSLYDSELVVAVELDAAESTCTDMNGITQACSLSGGPGSSLPTPHWVSQPTPRCDNVVSKVCRRGGRRSSSATVESFCLLVHGHVTIIFVVSVCLFVCLFVCAEFFSAVFDPISIKLGHMLYVWTLGLVVSPRI